MDDLFKCVACILVASILSVILSSNRKEFSILLAILVCSLIGITAVTYLSQILSFLKRIELTSNLNGSMITILFKTVGISIVSEIAIMICNDSGNTAFGKVLNVLTTAITLWICMPLFTELLDLMENILQAL